ncbi:hypothetical protein D3C80_1909180 [compost metagenome]
MKLTAKDGDISVYVDGALRLTGNDPGHRPSGKVGFYTSGFEYMLFDDIVFSVMP